MLTLTATSSVVQRAAVAPAETAAAKGRQQYPAEALLTIFWYYRRKIPAIHSPRLPQYCSMQYTFQYCLGLVLISSVTEDSTASVESLVRTLADFAVRTFLLTFPAYIFIFLTSCHS